MEQMIWIDTQLYKQYKVGGMKRVFVRGIICVLTALFSIYGNPLMIYPENEIKVKFEPLDAQMIMDLLVRQSECERKDDTGITYNEAQMLMKIAQAEAEIDGVEGMAMIMAVVLNRVKDPRFPNDIEGVIFQKYKGKYQFSPLEDGRYYNIVPTNECHLALADIEMGKYNHIEAIYFENAGDDCWQAKNCEYLYTVGHHRFYK